MAKSTNVDLKLPDWFEDPLYQKTQSRLEPFGSNLLEGKLPDFFSTLGKTGTPEFENILSLINRDTATAVNENLVRRNISRGGVGQNLLATTMADVGKKLRWEDFLRGQDEKKWLMGTGLDTLSGVRSSALDITGQKNQFNISRSGLDLQAQQFNAKQAAEEKAAKDKMWQDILKSGIGAAAIFATGGAAAPAVAGKMLGSASPSGMPSNDVFAAPANYYKSSAAQIRPPVKGIPWQNA